MRLRELFKKTEDWHPNEKPPGPEFKPTMPAGTVRVDVSDVYDWYKLGMHISDLKGMGKHDFGKGPPSTIFSFGSEEEEHKYIKDLEKLGLTTTDIDPKDLKQPKGMPRQKVDPTYNVENIDEAELDPKGWGETPMGSDVDYFGLRVMMRPSVFLKLSHPLSSGTENPEVAKHMQGGGKIAFPFLEIKDPQEWEDGVFNSPGKVVGHEGRNRMTQWIKMKGDEPIQVNVFLRNANRRRYITDDMIIALSHGIVSQSGELITKPFRAEDTQ